MILREDDLTDRAVLDLLARHQHFTAGESPPESCHALDLDGLRQSDVTVWTAWDEADLLGIGALKQIDPGHGEIKSMHTAERHRGRGVAAAILSMIIDEARRRSYGRLSLETGSMAAFASARDLYGRHGFVACPPFAAYVHDPNSVFMTLQLPGAMPGR